MDIFALLAAFGGGMFAAAIGALPALILSGLIAVISGLLGLAGVFVFGAENIAFSPFLAPHIAFTGGIGAAAFAANKRNSLQSGADITASLFGLNDPLTLLVGGVFGSLGFLVCFVYNDLLHLPTDNVAMTVFTCGIITRLFFGATGIVGVYDDKINGREWFPKGGDLLQTLVIGGAMGLIAGGVGMSLVKQGITGAGLSMFPIACFGISAASLIFAQAGQPAPGTHHMTYTAAAAFVLSGNVVAAIITGVFSSFLGDIMGRAFNSYCDTHIDPPAGAIFLTMFLLYAIF